MIEPYDDDSSAATTHRGAVMERARREFCDDPYARRTVMSSAWKASVAVAFIGAVLGSGYAVRAQGRNEGRGYLCRAFGDEGETHTGGHTAMSRNEEDAKRLSLRWCSQSHGSCHLEGACETVSDPGDDTAPLPHAR
jgi:hypothetical protein